MPGTRRQSGRVGLRATDIDLASLLPRPPRKIDQRAARRLIAGKRILITGAGGTIGSELVHQAASFEPSRLVLVDNAEFALYQIDMAMREAGHGDILVLIADRRLSKRTSKKRVST